MLVEERRVLYLEIPEADYLAEALQRGEDLPAFGQGFGWRMRADVYLGGESGEGVEGGFGGHFERIVIGGMLEERKKVMGSAEKM